jgi:hypothetical protein
MPQHTHNFFLVYASIFTDMTTSCRGTNCEQPWYSVYCPRFNIFRKSRKIVCGVSYYRNGLLILNNPAIHPSADDVLEVKQSFLRFSKYELRTANFHYCGTRAFRRPQAMNYFGTRDFRRPQAMNYCGTKAFRRPQAMNYFGTRDFRRLQSMNYCGTRAFRRPQAVNYCGTRSFGDLSLWTTVEQELFGDLRLWTTVEQGLFGDLRLWILWNSGFRRPQAMNTVEQWLFGDLRLWTTVEQWLFDDLRLWTVVEQGLFGEYDKTLRVLMTGINRSIIVVVQPWILRRISIARCYKRRHH